MNHHLAIKTHPRNLECTEKKRWLIHVTLPEHSTFPRLFAVKSPGGWMELNALQSQSWKVFLLDRSTYLQVAWNSLFCPGRRGKSKESFGHRLCWSSRDRLGVCWRLRFWPLHWCWLCCPLQCGHPLTGGWTEKTKLPQFLEQLSEMTPQLGFAQWCGVLVLLLNL